MQITSWNLVATRWPKKILEASFGALGRHVFLTPVNDFGDLQKRCRSQDAKFRSRCFQVTVLPKLEEPMLSVSYLGLYSWLPF